MFLETKQMHCFNSKFFEPHWHKIVSQRNDSIM